MKLVVGIDGSSHSENALKKVWPRIFSSLAVVFVGVSLQLFLYTFRPLAVGFEPST